MGLAPDCQGSGHRLCPGYYKMAHRCECGCHRAAAQAALQALADEAARDTFEETPLEGLHELRPTTFADDAREAARRRLRGTS